MSKRVLIVDDEKNLRNTLADILQDEGYNVSIADCGEKALKMCVRESYDFVLMDVRMPGIDGVEAFRRLRRDQTDIRVIMMSGYSMGTLEQTILDEGAVAFLRKPVDVDKVIGIMGETELAG